MTPTLRLKEDLILIAMRRMGHKVEG